MAIVNTHYGFCAKGGAAVKFTYTGEYNVRNDGVVELLTSGTIVFLEPKVIDLFMVGGGSSGVSVASGSMHSNPGGNGGGSGGYTRTIRRIAVQKNANIPVTIGAGGIAPDTDTSEPGGSSGWGTYSVNGGLSTADTSGSGAGRNGGSGGGSGARDTSTMGTGGSDGGNGTTSTYEGGKGQGITTREFGEPNGKLYAAGGGGGTYINSTSPVYALGGTGGGGAGGWCGGTSERTRAAGAGMANTGSGGGGGVHSGRNTSWAVHGGSGGSGIVCFRDAQELPELAGTWVLNERLYRPEKNVYAYTSFTGTKENTQTPKSFKAMDVDVNAVTAQLASGSRITLYAFSNNSWDQKYKIITFPAGATAYDEFRAWLANNATKQS